jgi:hypothetical protein
VAFSVRSRSGFRLQFFALSEDTIDIYAVLDCRQDPDAITSRLGERHIDRETRS